MRKLLFAVFTSVVLAFSSSARADVACTGDFFNPISDPDWSNIFPITILGASLGGSSNPPLMYEPPICVCPGYFGIPAPGLGVSYWNPLYIAEVQKEPGCMSSLGGSKLISSFDMERGEAKGTEASGNSRDGKVTRRQVHWYSYPLFKVVDLFTDLICNNSSTGFALAYITEFDMTHQNDIFAAYFAPENALFSGLLANAACAVDSVAAAFSWPVDPLFWCMGSAGAIDAPTGNAAESNSDQMVNQGVLGKFIYKMFRTGGILASIGPGAICSSHYSPVWYKSQFRLNPVSPVRSTSSPGPIYIGQTEFRWGLIPPSNYPTHESTNYLLWSGQQCCITFW